MGAELKIQDAHFTIDGQRAFLFGISYYGALGAERAIWQADLAQMKHYGFNWLRVWATWNLFGNDVSAVDRQGQSREPFLSRLEALIEECDRRGLIVDVTLTRAPELLPDLAAHRAAVETLLQRLRRYRNWYLDLANERNIRDERYCDFADLRELRALARERDPQRLVTASHAGDISPTELREYLLVVGVDFIAPHRPRRAGTAAQTEEQTKQYFVQMQQLGKIVPVHYQEPFRRDFGDWQPEPQDFLADLQGALRGGAAGWCFHNGSNRHAADGRPRRSFDLREGSLFAQLDEIEKKAFAELKAALPGTHL